MALGLIGGTIDHAKRLIDLYRSAGREAGHPDEKLAVGITSHFYVGETQEQALEDFYPRQRNPRPGPNAERSLRTATVDLDDADAVEATARQLASVDKLLLISIEMPGQGLLTPRHRRARHHLVRGSGVALPTVA